MLPNDELERSADLASLDWHAIARAFSPERRAIDCQLQWENCQSPTINTAPFTADEDAQLRALSAQFAGANWPAVAAALGTGRRAWQCFQRVQRSAQDDFKGKAWSSDEDRRLSELVERFGNDWQRIASMLAERTPAQCLHRWQKSQDPNIRRAKWQPDEDVRLRIATEVYGRGNWAQIARHVHGRTDVQCRERYVNILDPDVNSAPFTADEDALLVRLAAEHNHSWTKVAELMPGRTDGVCWRRWQLLVPAETLEQYRSKKRRTKK
jgi:myb proto-oncogene protein